jgi:membrane-bound serine protease (ClpP class)
MKLHSYCRLFLLFLTLTYAYSNLSAKPKRDQIWQKKVNILTFHIDKEIGPAMWRITQKAFNEASTQKSDLVIIEMNTYGGALDAADSIRTKVLNSPVPVYVFINNNAASAGALISIAADRIYMRDGASIGAATVVNQTGAALPDKYQSFMRSMMRSTAEAHGKDTVITNKDTTLRWYRDPLIAEAMVDPRTYIPGVNDTGKVLTFTTEEAIRHGYCEGKANTIQEVIKAAGIENHTLYEFKPTRLEKLIGFLVSPAVSGFLIMLIVAGIYFELQSPGIGFPLILAACAAVLYFAPLYLEGLANHWEIIIFIIGLVLIAIEIFAIPGFGVTGISGIILVVVGLSLAMINNRGFHLEPGVSLLMVVRSLFIVISSMAVSLGLSIYLSGKLLKSSAFDRIALKAELTSTHQQPVVVEFDSLIGQLGITATMLRPSGKVQIGEEVYDAVSEFGYIEKNESVKVVRHSSGQIYVVKFKN